MVYKCLSFSLTFLFSISCFSNESILGYWATSQSIVKVSNCDKKLCATIEHIFVDKGVDPKSILDTNNRNKSLRDRTLIGINLLENFDMVSSDITELKGGKIYDPGRGRIFKSNLYFLENGNLKVEGCMMGICDYEEWLPLNVSISEDGSVVAELK